MKGGGSHKLRFNKLSLYLIALLCFSLAFWAWERAPLLTTFVPPSEQLDISFSLPTSVETRKAHSEYINQDSAAVDVPLDSSTEEEDPSDQLTKEIPSQSTAEGTFATPATPSKENDFSRSQLGHDTVPIAPYQSSAEDAEDKDLLNAVTSDNKECNYGKGKWVPDDKRPLYSGFGCKRFLAEPWSCRRTLRKDFSFEKYRWQPEGCQMPEFSGQKFLKRMQHKTIAIVGDSLGRQQFQSLMCMVTGGKEYHVVKDVGGEYGLALARGAARPDGWAYRFPRTNTTILYYWSASLCELEPINRTDPSTSFAMHLDRPATFLKQYLDRFDVLVLNTGHHWNRGKINANRWVMYVGGAPLTDRKLQQIWNAKNLTVQSVSKWLDTQIPRHPRLKVFFRTLSPRHFANGDWNTGGKCDSTKPLSGGSEVTEDGSADPITEAAVKGTRVKLLDITGLSQLRDESHMSNSRNPKGGYDCLHWCLPGIPDTWNEILAARV